MSWFPEYITTKTNSSVKTVIECHFNCRQCAQPIIIDVLDNEYKSWIKGDFTQVAFPNLSNSDKEMFISGTCDVCWAKLFSSKE